MAACRPVSTAQPNEPKTPVNTPSESDPKQAAPAPVVKRAATADEEIAFQALDLTRPDLAAVAAAVKAGDYDAASHAWALHLRERKGFQWGGANATVPKTYSAQVADDAANGNVQGGQVQFTYAFPDGKIDWHYNATHHAPGQARNTEWQWQLNRMAFWADMARAYTVTQDDKYPQAFAQQLHSWIEQCPVPEKALNKEGSAWRTIEAGIRMGHFWTPSFLRFLPSPALSDADIIAYTRSTFEHARYLRANATNVNWLLMEMNGLATVGCFFPEFRDAADWRSYAFARLAEEAQKQLLPDGGQYELSTGYHNDVVIGNFLAARNVALWTGRENEIPATYVTALERAFDWSMYLSTPNRNRPKNNDSWPGDIRPTLQKATALYPQREDFLWFATDGKEGKPPEKTSVFLDWSGFAIERGSWETDANYLFFNVGPLGYGGLMGMGHAHQDKLNVALWAYGREILFDGGGSSYAWDKWRVWSRSSLSHNCVLVDGLGQNRGNSGTDADAEHDVNRVSQEPIKASWQSNADFDFATGIYDDDYGTSEYSNKFPELYDTKLGPQKRRIAVQRRSVFFLKPDIYIVADHMTPIDAQPHTYQARWQLLSTETTQNPKTLAISTGDQNQPNLAVVPLLTAGLDVKSASGQETPEILGWHCRKDVKPQNVAATSVLHTRSGAGPQEFLTLLLPLKPDQKDPVAAVKKGANDVEVQFADGRRIRIASSEAGGIKVQEIAKDGKLGRSLNASVEQGPTSDKAGK